MSAVLLNFMISVSEKFSGFDTLKLVLILCPLLSTNILCVDKLCTLVKKNICKPHTSGLSTFGKAKRSSRGITWSRALHALQGRRLKRDYPRPDVSLSKEKEKKKKRKETCSPLRSSHILLLLVSVKQWGVGARLSAASHRLSLKVQDFRFRKRLPLNAVDTSSIMLQTNLFQVD